jgi:hypothetical protein
MVGIELRLPVNLHEVQPMKMAATFHLLREQTGKSSEMVTFLV